MSRAVVVHQTGGPDVLTLEERDVGAPGAGEIRVRNAAIGINYIDTYHRSGLYPLALPFTPGVEGAGEVTAVGPGVDDFRPGDRVAYAVPTGSYADDLIVPAARAVPLPDGIAADVAATLMTKGGTAHYLLFETWPLKSGDTMLVHAASGGVGTYLVQWGAALGATVIALAGSDEKVATALDNGAAHGFNSREAGWVDKVRAATGGRGVDVVYDGVGKATFEDSLDCLRPRGLMVSFGNASGPVTGVNLGILATKGSLYVTRPTTTHYHGDRDSLRRTMATVFDAVAAGRIRPAINQRFKLDAVQKAHRALESRQTTGATVLVP